MILKCSPVKYQSFNQSSQDKNNLVYLIEKRKRNSRDQILYFGNITTVMLQDVLQSDKFNIDNLHFFRKKLKRNESHK